MSLQSLIASSIAKDNHKLGLSEERLYNNIDNLRYLISFFRQYPDIMIDMIKGPDSNFEFMFNQRVFLRCVMRHRVVYATFPRGFSKSFLSMMALMLRCVLFPGCQLFITTGGKYHKNIK